MVPEKRVEVVAQAVHGPSFSRTTKKGNELLSHSDCKGQPFLSSDKTMKVQEVLRTKLLGLVGEGKLYANRKRLADAFDVDPTGLNNFLDEKKTYQGANIDKVLTKLGAKIVFPDERADTAREIKWIDAKTVSAGNGQSLPPADDYFAVPLVGEAGAGPGVMPTEEIKSWVLVYRHQHAVRFKRNLLGVEIDKGSTSMTPLLRPGDIVLVDRDDFHPSKPGGIFLVREPGQEGGAMVKRVATKEVNGDMMITFYSENAAENPAETYSLKGHYNDEISHAIVGRCVWAWSDITGK